MALRSQFNDLTFNPRHASWLCPLLITLDAALCGLIIWRIPYTEIDWRAYMQQVSQYTAGERDYVKIYGATGPLVYPAAHVYIYRALHAVTDGGEDVLLAQVIFAVVYLVTLSLVMACYRAAKVPPYVYPLLVLSKRLHSIFLLRLFNDCFAVLFLFLAIYCYQRRLWTLGSVSYSVGLGVKMSLLLALPAVAVVLFQALGPQRALKQAGLMGQLQIVVAWPFLSVNARSYFSRAFEFTRQFLFKWTVNWRFVGEDVFLSRRFSITLLATHISLLCLFIMTRWLRPSGQPLSRIIRMLFSPPSAKAQALIARHVTPEFILTTVLSANAIGMLCARSLHYQFYSWIAWATPFLLWRAGFHPVLQYALWAAQEWAWNVYPSTGSSSTVVVAVLGVVVAGVWYGARESKQPRVE
ncbi:dolichyl-P-Man:Man(5)GlcNAc(2)-PP-dolichol alpha-1,3-mannosyltransferase [Elasticomyces elasticus]|nr:dolichyl-P-Man:Man(5)GlcNAc(2)-PP-dolichol alpha-1,3-mannosyltransferase [Elasticomyces elasticus]